MIDMKVLELQYKLEGLNNLIEKYAKRVRIAAERESMYHEDFKVVLDYETTKGIAEHLDVLKEIYTSALDEIEIDKLRIK